MTEPASKARSASAAQATDEVGYLAATVAGSVPAASAARGSGSSGSNVGGGPASRLSCALMSPSCLLPDPAWSAEAADERTGGSRRRHRQRLLTRPADVDRRDAADPDLVPRDPARCRRTPDPDAGDGGR